MEITHVMYLEDGFAWEMRENGDHYSHRLVLYRDDTSQIESPWVGKEFAAVLRIGWVTYMIAGENCRDAIVPNTLLRVEPVGITKPKSKPSTSINIREITIIPEFGSAYTILNGVLLCLAINADHTIALDEGEWSEIDFTHGVDEVDGRRICEAVGFPYPFD